MKTHKNPIKTVLYLPITRMSLRLYFLLGTLSTIEGSISRAQDISTTPDAKEKVRNILDDYHAPSARGDALSGALVTSADDLDATWHNPAGIGGLQLGKSKGPWIRKLYFPWIALSANQNSSNLARDFNNAGGNNDRVIGKSIMAAHAGQRQYARAHILSGIVVGRLLLVPINDLQLAATPKADDPSTPDALESDLISGHFKSISGVGGGVSTQSSDGSLSLGYFGYSVSRTDVEGDFDFDDMTDLSERRKVINAVEQKSSGTGHHIGMIWQIGKSWSPTLGIAIRDLGDTSFRAKSRGFTGPKIQQNTSIGFTMGPQFKSSGALKLTLQADRLNDPEVALGKKYRLGIEFLLGGLGSRSLFALRAGATQAGGSVGLGVNLGLLGCNVAIHSVDIGAGNQKVIERRGVIDASVNVAEF